MALPHPRVITSALLACLLATTFATAGPASDTGKPISIDYIGSGILAGGSSGTLAISGGLSISAAATVQSSSITLAVNDVIRGTAEFRVA